MLATLSVAGVAATARAAPPAKTQAPAVVCEATPTPEEARLITGRELYADGDALFREEDYLGAIKAWKQVLLLMPEMNAKVRAQLAHAHRRAYVGGDKDPEHLHEARTLFHDQLTSPGLESTARADIEAELAGIKVDLDALAAAERRVQDEKERVQAAELEKIRQEQIAIDQKELAKTEAEHQRKIQKIYYGMGGSLVGLGGGSLTAMAIFLEGGARLDQMGQATANMTGVTDGSYQALLAEGEAKNRAALTTGVVGGVLVAAGGALLVVAAIRYRRVIRTLEKKRMAVYPALGGLQVRF